MPSMPGVVVSTFDPSTREAEPEAGDFCETEVTLGYTVSSKLAGAARRPCPFPKKGKVK